MRHLETPTRFSYEFMPTSLIPVIPEVSSEKPRFIPIGPLALPALASHKLRIMRIAAVFHFAVLCSTMHMAWTRAVCGRLEIRYPYSAKIVFNNFPWPSPTAQERRAIESAGQSILDSRHAHPHSTLAYLYSP